MSAFSLKRFSHVETLKSIQPKYLIQLLSRYGDYFAGRGLTLPKRAEEELDYDALAKVLMNPDAQTPDELANDLYYVDEMATRDGMEALLESAGTKLGLGPDPTPADVAVVARLNVPELMEEEHAERSLLRSRRTFESFQSRDGVDTALKEPQRKTLAALEKSLGEKLEEMKRGRACRVFVFPKDDGTWFMVRRGDPFTRQGTMNEEKSSSVFFRPEKYDILKYDDALGELSINADGNGKLVKLYLEKFGEHLFGDRSRFPNQAKYNFDPLKVQGSKSLNCSDVRGIEWIRLKEIQIHWGGPFGEIETRRAKDLFAAYETRDKKLPNGRLTRVSFLIKFADSKTARTVTLRGQNVASYTRDSDAALVESWLTLRGFVKSRQKGNDEPAPRAA